jgi:hypothetical protein
MTARREPFHGLSVRHACGVAGGERHVQWVGRRVAPIRRAQWQAARPARTAPAAACTAASTWASGEPGLDRPWLDRDEETRGGRILQPSGGHSAPMRPGRRRPCGRGPLRNSPRSTDGPGPVRRSTASTSVLAVSMIGNRSGRGPSVDKADARRPMALPRADDVDTHPVVAQQDVADTGTRVRRPRRPRPATRTASVSVFVATMSPFLPRTTPFTDRTVSHHNSSSRPARLPTGPPATGPPHGWSGVGGRGRPGGATGQRPATSVRAIRPDGSGRSTLRPGASWRDDDRLQLEEHR